METISVQGTKRNMGKLRVHTFSISVDGYGAGPGQDIDNPLGVGGMALHGWFRQTRTFQQMFSRAEQNWSNGKVHLINQLGAQILPYG